MPARPDVPARIAGIAREAQIESPNRVRLRKRWCQVDEASGDFESAIETTAATAGPCFQLTRQPGERLPGHYCVVCVALLLDSCLPPDAAEPNRRTRGAHFGNRRNCDWAPHSLHTESRARREARLRNSVRSESVRFGQATV